MPQFSSLLTNLKSRLQLDTDPTYDTALKAYMNFGQQDVNRRWLFDFMRQDETVNTSATVQNYPLAAEEVVYDVRNMTSIISLRYIRDMDIDKYDVAQVVTGPPTFYRVEGQYKPSVSVASVAQIQLYPIPDGVYAISVRAYRRLVDMVNDTDISGIPEAFQELLIFYAANAFYSSRGDPRAQEQFDKYENGLLSMVEQLGAVPTDQIDVLRANDDFINTGQVRFPPSFGQQGAY